MPVAANGSAFPWYSVVKAGLFILLACNTAFYLVAGSLSEVLDATAWFALLTLFEVETRYGHRLRSSGASVAIRIGRAAAAAAVGVAGLGYLYQKEWLDALNTGLWIMVVVLLEFELRRPRDALRHAVWFGALVTAVYAALAALVVVWAGRGEWLDAYDALLWLLAFATIELDVLRFARREVAIGLARSESTELR